MRVGEEGIVWWSRDRIGRSTEESVRRVSDV